ncbi:MAG TPA: CBS domain-containing protein [Dissulfurispiraceae bacterium]|nr:CBS domain-containing protein [Dissulfurispiraceae bacterium]
MGTCRTARDIMHPRVSLHAKDTGEDIAKKLMSPYPALPVVNDRTEVVGIVSEYDVLSALAEGRTVHEFSAQSIMSCGHAGHTDEPCKTPLTVTPVTSIQKIVDTFVKQNVTLLPVVDKGKLVGIISRTNVINSLAEKGFWPGSEMKKRTPK